MSWEIGYDSNWKRGIGYGVPATCDFPGCGASIDRGLAHVCGGEPYGGEDGCGLFFCGEHLLGSQCESATGKSDEITEACGDRGRPLARVVPQPAAVASLTSSES